MSRRSINAELLHRIEYSLRDEETAKRLDALEDDLRLIKEATDEMLRRVK